MTELFQLNDGGRSLFGMFQEKMRTVKFNKVKTDNFWEQFCYKEKERNVVIVGEEGE